MWTTTIIHHNSYESDRAIKVINDFGNKITVETDLEERVTRKLYGGIQVGNDIPYEPNTEKYLKYLSNIDNEVNPAQPNGKEN